MSERLTREIHEEIEEKIGKDITVPGEKEASLQRLKPYGRSLFLDEKGALHVSEPYSLIEFSREAAYKIKLSAKGLPTKNIEDLTVTEAEEYYNAIKGEKKRLQAQGKLIGIPTAWEDELFLAYEHCALALRVIGELSDDVIPQRLLDDYQRLLREKKAKSAIAGGFRSR